MASKVQSAAMVVGAGALWGIMGVASRYLLEHDVSGYQIIFCRALVTSLVLFAILCRVDRSKIRIDARDTWMFLGSGVCGLTAFNLCYFSALPTLSLSMATVLLYTAPVYVTVISLFVFNEKMTRYKAVALVAAILGCVFTTGVLGDAQGDTVGVLFGILAGFFYSLYTLFGAFALKKYSPMTFTAYTFLFAGLATYPLSDLGSIQDLLRKDILVPFFLILIGVLFTLVPFFLYSKGLQNLDPGVAAVLAYTEPMVATVVGFMVYDEPITAFAVIGILLILTSIVLL
ncbi:MAG: EamA family transporter, partial [archaeon]|nr:EamA family transporter [archaeon]